MKTKGTLYLVIAVLFLTTGSVQASQYSITDLGGLGGYFGFTGILNNLQTIDGYLYRVNSRSSIFAYGKHNKHMHDAGYHVAGRLGKKGYQNNACKWNDPGQGAGFGILDNIFYNYGYAINNAGEVAGSLTLPYGRTHAFYYNGESMLDLGTLGGSSSYAYGINDSGQIVGMSFTAQGTMHAFLYDGTDMVDLNTLLADTLGWDYLLAAYDINNNHEIVGIGIRDGKLHGFLLTTAVPLPGSMVLLASGILPFILLRRKFTKNDTCL